MRVCIVLLADLALVAALPRGSVRFTDIAAEAGLTDVFYCGREGAKDYILDKRDPVKVVARVPPGFGYVARDASWRVYKRCAPPVHIHGGE